jgi:hypothetical protein
VRRIFLAALFVVSSGISAHAQNTQVWPEISAFTRLNDRMRFYFLATTVKESRESTEGEFGPNFDFYVRPLRNPTRFGGLRLDESKNRFLLLGWAIATSIRSAAVPTNIALCSRQRPAFHWRVACSSQPEAAWYWLYSVSDQKPWTGGV